MKIKQDDKRKFENLKLKTYHLKPTLAALPVLANLLDFYHALWIGGLIVLGFWGTVLFFRFAAAFLPETIRGWVRILWFAALAQAGWYFWDLAPMWVMSVFLLGSEEEIRKIFSKGLGFWMLAAWLGLGAEILGRGFQREVFLRPAGSFLLLGVAAALWKPRVEALK